MLDGGVPSTVDAKVLDGVVTLMGSAEWRYQRDEAERVVGNVMGVLGLVNEIVLSTSQPYAGDVQHSIRKAIERRARLDAESLSVDAADGTVTLSGVVGSLAEHDAAIEAAWSAPGVTSVDDQIVVSADRLSPPAT
jgi:osmotically-inducible protein OsmY